MAKSGRGADCARWSSLCWFRAKFKQCSSGATALCESKRAGRGDITPGKPRLRQITVCQRPAMYTGLLTVA
eukprot:5146452-Pyramimonas_sp.AAC.1